MCGWKKSTGANKAAPPETTSAALAGACRLCTRHVKLHHLTITSHTEHNFWPYYALLLIICTYLAQSPSTLHARNDMLNTMCDASGTSSPAAKLSDP
jgi:hypothetical protein